ncbi:MAG: hypothetical protein EWM72_03427 [Nitrospira sp.]|nr:MAG: hypothetical protein EWM72_03427 [Nitrospira sp.]
MRIVSLLLRSAVAMPLCLALTTSIVSAEVLVNGWRKLDPINQAAYMQGVLDVATTLSQSSRESAKNKGLDIRDFWKLRPDVAFYASIGCDRVSQLPPEQKLAILQKHVNNNPEKWDYPMTFMVQNAFWKMCEE